MSEHAFARVEWSVADCDGDSTRKHHEHRVRNFSFVEENITALE
jgi:hypothetical protein